ncbi:MAG: Rrf2 family transcriptional regulator [Anaerolineales bacterium]|nr:Rrf2 family transcriptional regulator [Anaerolineales bacterium]NTW12203.1 Rrf2 family transcriptional regulator [Anaerolineales bacterium]
MLKINRQTDYAVRVILALAQRGEGVRLSSAEIQQEMLIPKAFMTRIVAQLAREGLVNTFPGRDGGLMLPRPASQINLKEVVEAFEGPILLSECMQVKGEDDCPFQSNCPVRSKWGRVQAAMMREMASISFEDLAKEALGVPMSMPSLV